MLHVGEFDLSDVEQQWKHAVRALADGCIRGVTDGVREGIEAALATGRWKDRTGETRAQTNGIVTVVTQNGAAGEMQSLVEWASYLDAGTKAHWIRPKAEMVQGELGPLQAGQSRRKATDIGTSRVALRWQDDGGTIRFARAVYHPGTKPTGYMGEAYLKCKRVIVREVERGADRARDIMSRH